MLVKVPIDTSDHRITLRRRQQLWQKFHDTRIGIHRSEFRYVARCPRTQAQSSSLNDEVAHRAHDHVEVTVYSACRIVIGSVLKANREGLVDKARTAVFVGRERHVQMARAHNLPYPQRGIRTASHLFIFNFKPERYSLGDPYNLDADNSPSTQELTDATFVTLADEDAGPTKAWLVNRRNDPKWKSFFDHAYGKRSREELFDMEKDPPQMRNVAGDVAYASAVKELRRRLMNKLKRTDDPRLIDDGRFFETPPMAGPLPDDVAKPNRSRKK